MALQIIRDIAVFLIAIIILVGFHEYGHFITAKKCGVKVLRFSLGFGPIFYKRTGRDGCEYAFSLIPLGGYVKMLDTREGEVKPEELKYEFNSQPVWKRLAIVAAGPLFNILLAFFLFYFMFLMGVQALKPYVSNVEEDKPAYAAGLRNDDLIVRIGDTDVIDWEDVSYTLIQYIGEKSVPVTVKHADGVESTYDLNIDGWSVDRSNPNFLEPLGFMPKLFEPTTRVGFIVKDSAAEKSDLKLFDKIVSVNGTAVNDWYDFISYIHKNPGKDVTFAVQRPIVPADYKGSGTAEEFDKFSYEEKSVTVTPVKDAEGNYKFGIAPFTDAVKSRDVRFIRSYGFLEAIPKSFVKMYSVCKLTVVTIVKFIDGNIPVNNISGPIAIAQSAGMSLSVGIAYFLSFLGIISINLGIMNLLPVPVLDGGHIMFYLYEMITGRKVSEQVMGRLIFIGMFLLLLLMAFAIFNDLYYN
jgi:regulator of sigma E protease